MVTFAVCDDEWETAKYISHSLRTYYPEECEIKTYTDGESMLLDCQWIRFDAIFLDIGLPGLNGMDVAEMIRKNDQRVRIVFVTQRSELAHKGYIYGAFRFVRKSNLDQELYEAAKSLYELLSSQSEHRIFKTPTGKIIISVKDIKYIEANGHFMSMVCNGGEVQVCETMREIEEKVKCLGFIRIHKSYLVNYRFIGSTDKNEVHLIDGKKLPLSRNKLNEVKKELASFRETALQV